MHMQLKGNTVLITGGASGIGLAIGQRFLAAGSKVILAGRRLDKLTEARSAHPEMEIIQADVGDANQRIQLIEDVTARFPDLNVLVNNAGIQRRLDLTRPEPFDATRSEISINLEGPVHLSMLALPHLMKKKKAAVVQVTSGLAFTPLAFVPVYSATKAAMRSFTLSLRHQLRGSPVEVIEIIPPAVQTDLGGPGHHDFGAPLQEFADDVMRRLDQGETEIAYGFAMQASKASRQDLDAIFERMNSPAGS